METSAEISEFLCQSLTDFCNPLALCVYTPISKMEGIVLLDNVRRAFLIGYWTVTVAPSIPQVS
jgi:hypothetical protein